MSFEFKKLFIPEVVFVTPKIIEDERGFFTETYKFSDFAKYGIEERFVQDNHSKSAKNILRGLHYQKKPTAQGKLIKCIKGSIFDVAVDIRMSSPTYGKWVGEELSDINQKMLYVPSGFAHGFLVLSETAEVFYKCTKEYSPENDRGIIWNDPEINIAWPVSNPTLSAKDRSHGLLRDADNDFK